MPLSERRLLRGGVSPASAASGASVMATVVDRFEGEPSTRFIEEGVVILP